MKRFLFSKKFWTTMPTAVRNVVWLGILFIAFIGSARAAFVGPYALSNFNLTDTNSDSEPPPVSTTTLILTGPNNGSGLSGTSDFTVVAAASGIVSFDWSYSSADDPGADGAAYMLGGVPTPISDTDGESGQLTFSVIQGEIFGFEMWSADNTGEAGILTVTNFSAPMPLSTVPEPAPWLLLTTAGAIVAGYILRGRKPFGERN